MKRPAAPTSDRILKVISDIGDKPTIKAVILSGQSISKYPDIIASLMKMKAPPGRPAPSQDSTPYLGGKIYWSPSTSNFRVMKRAGDRIDQSLSCNWKNKKERQTQWALACSLIEQDPRNRE